MPGTCKSEAKECETVGQISKWTSAVSQENPKGIMMPVWNISGHWIRCVTYTVMQNCPKQNFLIQLSNYVQGALNLYTFIHTCM